MFLGEYDHNLDEKNRVIIPRKFRETVNGEFIITRGMDHCLFAFSLSEWETIEQKLKALPVTKKDARAFTRFFFSSATEVTCDKQGRILIPPLLKEYANLEKECVLIGVSNRFEIWDKSRWVQYTVRSEETFNELAEDLLDFHL